jgi:uncharacterized protein YukE
MSDRFQVQPEQVTAAAEAFAGQQQRPTELASTLQGAPRVDTGDLSLDGQVQTLLRDVVTAMQGLATGLEQDAAGLRQMVQSYQATDRAAARTFDQIGNKLK